MKSFFLPIIFVLFSLQVFAQNKSWDNTPIGRAKYFTMKMMQDLALDDSLENSLFEINVAVSKQFDSVKAITFSDDKLRKRSYVSIYAYRDSCLNAVLPRKKYLLFQDLEREKYLKRKQKEN